MLALINTPLYPMWQKTPYIHIYMDVCLDAEVPVRPQPADHVQCNQHQFSIDFLICWDLNCTQQVIADLQVNSLISRECLGQLGNNKIPDCLGFSQHKKTRLSHQAKWQILKLIPLIFYKHL